MDEDFLTGFRASIASNVEKEMDFANQYTMYVYFFRLLICSIIYVGDCIRNKS